ncbi:recombinase family protein [Georgenia sp. 10Sc9-8]|uniref:Recombinase family protein n=1 Tax=Georgenia halotolerans TaxID=3028317 RepID=A0ABT5TZN7_9MICO|nr:recombinase family protein [Georgenia halotolerans]
MARTLKVPHRSRPLALGYTRVSTADQAEHGASLEAQRSALAAEADRRGWDIEFVVDEGVSGKVPPTRRAGLGPALAALDAHEADALMAIRLDRVSRSVADFAALVDRAGKHQWGLVLLSPALDLADAAGRFTANVLASAAQYERELIGARTREGLAQRRAEGVRLGRPATVPAYVVTRIAAARAEGSSWAKIADALNADGVPTAQGGARWWPATVRKVADRAPTP